MVQKDAWQVGARYMSAVIIKMSKNRPGNHRLAVDMEGGVGCAGGCTGHGPGVTLEETT